jgi:hypothetical protein
LSARPLPLELAPGHTRALADRDVRCIYAALRYRRAEGARQAAGFDVTLGHLSGHGAAVTASGNTLEEALARGLTAFDRYIRPELRLRPKRAPK